MDSPGRLDLVTARLFTELSRSKAGNLIKLGLVKVDGVGISCPSFSVSIGQTIELEENKPIFVSQAGYKLEFALDKFNLSVHDKIALDCGLSTGGFSQCLINHGIAKIYGVDVGTNQVDSVLAQNQKLIVMEQTNLRSLKNLPVKIDLFTLDLSFISLTKIFDSVASLAAPKAQIIALIKPQFELPKKLLSRDGIVKSEESRALACQNVITSAANHGFNLINLVQSPIGDGKRTNIELLALFEKI